MSERWAWDGPRDNIHVFHADDPNMRVCFLTSDGPTEDRANLIAAAPDLLEALMDVLPYARAAIGAPEPSWSPDNVVLKARAAIAKAQGLS